MPLAYSWIKYITRKKIPPSAVKVERMTAIIPQILPALVSVRPEGSMLRRFIRSMSSVPLIVAKPPKSLALSYVLWWFGGAFAVHRIYLGAFRSAAAMAGLFWGGLALGAVMSKKSSLWVGGVAVPPLWVAMILAWMAWWLLDAFLIPGVRRRQAQVGSVQSLSTVFA